MFNPYSIQLTVSIVIFAAITFLSIKRRSNVNFTIVWLIVGLVSLIQGIFPSLLDKLSGFLGVGYPPTLMLVLAILMLLGIIFFIISELTVAHDKIRELSIHVSLLNDEMRLLKQDVLHISGKDDIVIVPEESLPDTINK